MRTRNSQFRQSFLWLSMNFCLKKKPDTQWNSCNVCVLFSFSFFKWESYLLARLTSIESLDVLMSSVEIVFERVEDSKFVFSIGGLLRKSSRSSNEAIRFQRFSRSSCSSWASASFSLQKKTNLLSKKKINFKSMFLLSCVD